MATHFKKLLLGAALGTLASVSVVGQSMAQQLFEEVPLKDQQIIVSQKATGQMRSRLVKIDQNTVDDVFGISSSQNTLQIDLFPGRSISLQKMGFDKAIGGNSQHWSGKSVGFEDGSATIIKSSHGINGQIYIGGDVFRIRPTGIDGIHQVREIDTSVLPEEGAIVDVPASALPVKKTSIGENTFFSKLAARPRIDVMIMYTPAALIEAGGEASLRSEATLAVAMMNDVLINNKARAYKYRMRSFRPTGCRYDENAGDYGDLLSDIRDASTCIGGRAATFRDRVNADLVAVLRQQAGSTYCGIGYRLVNGGPASYGFSVTSLGCLAGQTLAHEVGHNMGLHHDRYVVDGAGPEYHFGLARPDLEQRTIMAYNRECSDQGIFCSRIPLFTVTNPAAYWEGNKFGFGVNNPKAALNSKKIRDNWNSIAAFR